MSRHRLGCLRPKFEAKMPTLLPYHPQPFADEDARQFVKNTLRSEMAKRGMTYRDLADALEKMGLPEEEKNLRNKVARGTFTAAFFMQCLRAVGASKIETGVFHFEYDSETGKTREIENYED